jgi:hypothetical protein
MRRITFLACLAPAFAVGLLGGWLSGTSPGTLLEHDGGEYRFRYPDRFELTHDTFEVATPDSRIVALRGNDGSVLMVHSFAPASNLSAQEFADEIARQRVRALSDLGVDGGEIEHQVSERVRSAGALREAVRQEFDIESGGLHFAQVARYVRVAVGDQELFLSLHTPARHAARAESAFEEVLGSLEFAHPRTAANRSSRRDP